MKIYSTLAKRLIEVPDRKPDELSGEAALFAEGIANKVRAILAEQKASWESDAVANELARVSDELLRAQKDLAAATIRLEAETAARVAAEAREQTALSDKAKAEAASTEESTEAAQIADLIKQRDLAQAELKALRAQPAPVAKGKSEVRVVIPTMMVERDASGKAISLRSAQ